MIVGLSVPFMYLRVPAGLETELDTFLENPKSASKGIMEFLEVLITENLRPWKKTAKSIKSIEVLRSDWHDPQVQIEVTT
jgi:hypothetical protein